MTNRNWRWSDLQQNWYLTVFVIVHSESLIDFTFDVSSGWT